MPKIRRSVERRGAATAIATPADGEGGVIDSADPSGLSDTDTRQVALRERALRQIARLYLAFAAVLVPWVVYLAVSLPKREVSDHYRNTWVGFDIALIIVLAWIGVCAWRRDPRIVLSATVGGTLLCADAWFDVTTSAPGSAHAQAIASALLLELPCATLCLLLARRSLAALVTRPGADGNGLREP